MNDIQLIGGDGVEEILSSHTNIFDRYGASMYFSKFSERHDLPENTRLWYSRAALYEFKAGLETISSCFQEQWARKAWDNSEVKAKLRSDVLMKCISKVRDIALHTANVSLENRKFYYLVAAKGAPLEGEIVEIFITPIVSDKHTTKSKISHEEIQWFNRQLQSWPLKYLLKEVWWRLAVSLREFKIEISNKNSDKES